MEFDGVHINMLYYGNFRRILEWTVQQIMHIVRYAMCTTPSIFF